MTSRARVNEANYQASYTAGLASEANQQQQQLGESSSSSSMSQASSRAQETVSASAKLARVLAKENSQLDTARGSQQGALINMLSARGAVGKARVTSAMLGETVAQMGGVKKLLAHVVKTSDTMANEQHQTDRLQYVSDENFERAQQQSEDAKAQQQSARQHLNDALAAHMDKSKALHVAKQQQENAQTAVSKVCLR